MDEKYEPLKFRGWDLIGATTKKTLIFMRVFPYFSKIEYRLTFIIPNSKSIY